MSADNTTQVGSLNSSSLLIQLETIINDIADLSLTLSLYPILKKGIESPDYSDKLKKINKKIKSLEEAIPKNVLEDVENLLSAYAKLENLSEYLRTLDSASNLLLNLDNSQIKAKIQSIVPRTDLSNYYTKSESENLFETKGTFDSDDYYLKTEVYSKTESDNKYETQGTSYLVISDLLNSSSEIVQKLTNLKNSLNQEYVEKVLELDNFKEIVDKEIASYSFLCTPEETISGKLIKNSNLTDFGENFKVIFYKVTSGEKIKLNVNYKGMPTGSGPDQVRVAWFVNYENGGITNSTIAVNVAMNNNANGDYYLVVPDGYGYLAINFLKANSASISVNKLGYTGTVIKEIHDNLLEIHDNLLEINNILYVDSWEELIASELLNDKLIVKNSTIHPAGSLTESDGYFVNIYEVIPGQKIKVELKTCKVSNNIYAICALYPINPSSDDSNYFFPFSTENIFNKNNIGTHTFVVPEGYNYLATNNPNVVISKSTGLISVFEDLTERKGSIKCYWNGDVVKCVYNDGIKEFGYRFLPTMNNNLMSFDYVGVRESFLEPFSLDFGNFSTLVQISSDMIGPLLISCDGIKPNSPGGGSAFIGANHNAGTGLTLNYSVFCDGVPLQQDKEILCNEVTVSVTNLLKIPMANDTFVNALLETTIFTVRANLLFVEVRHDYCYPLPANTKIEIYYGMQSMFGKSFSDKILTPRGAYTTWTEYTNVNPINDNFVISSYPQFNQFVQKLVANSNNTENWCQSTTLDINYGIGNKSYLDGNKYSLITGKPGGTKLYHVLITNHSIYTGESYSWCGVYSWYKDSE